MFRRSFVGSFLGSLFGFAGAKTAVTENIPEPYKQVTQFTELKPCNFVGQSTIRIWKLGSLEHQIYPTKKAIKVLAKALCPTDGKMPTDIIWGPDLTCEVVQGGSVNIIASTGKDGTTYYKIKEDGTVETIIEKVEGKHREPGR